MTTTPFPTVPPPWSTKCTAWLIPIRLPTTTPLPAETYSPLSASHAPFSDEAHCGKFRGGIGMLQILRYTETPVGPYDELLLIPGYFDTPVGGGKKGLRNNRITAIWVSQKDTCWNGRRNWNIPKHLARFKFTTLASSLSPTSPIRVEVFPEDTSATQPFFTATIKPIKWLPYFPCSSAWSAYLGLDGDLVQPPLPEGDMLELCGTETWKKTKAVLYSRKASLVWVDLKQQSSKAEAEGQENEEGDGVVGRIPENENWLPGLKRWHIALSLENASLDIFEPEILTK